MCTNSTSRRLVVMTPQHGMCGHCSMKLELGCENRVKGIPPVRLRGPVLCPCPGLNDDDEDRLRARAGAGDHLMSPNRKETALSLVRSRLPKMEVSQNLVSSASERAVTLNLTLTRAELGTLSVITLFLSNNSPGWFRHRLTDCRHVRRQLSRLSSGACGQGVTCEYET